MRVISLFVVLALACSIAMTLSVEAAASESGSSQHRLKKMVKVCACVLGRFMNSFVSANEGASIT
jgi:hypothetical protein